jgi:hypothetical protein
MPPGVYRWTAAAREQARQKSLRHGQSVASAGKRTPTYISWQSMHARCRHPSVQSYPHYGGRGIRVCDRWSSFAAFSADMGDRPEGMTLDRIDRDGHYEPGNCRWATVTEQTRGSRNAKLTPARAAWIRTQPASSRREMARLFGVAEKTILSVQTGQSWT